MRKCARACRREPSAALRCRTSAIRVSPNAWCKQVGRFRADLFYRLSPNTKLSFSYNTDEAEAGPGSQTTPSNVPGHEFTSFYEFSSPPYGGTITIPAISAMFTPNNAALVVNDDLPIIGADINNYVSDGTYDWIEILGSTTVDGPTGQPSDGEEWTLAFFADPSWFNDGSVIPDDLPGSYTPLMLGLEFDAAENEIGSVGVNIGGVTITPEPSLPVLAGLGSFLMLLARRRDSAA